MAFIDSLAGQVNKRLWASPIAYGAISAGLAAGAFAGASSFANTDGNSGEKVDAGLSSAFGYGTATTLGVGAVGLGISASSSFRAGWDGHRGKWTPYHPDNLAASMRYGARKNAEDLIGMVGGKASSAASSWAKGISAELKTAGGWKKTLMRPTVSGGIGAVIGGVVGNQMSDGDPGTTAVATAGGAVVGAAAGRMAKASSTWSKWGSARRAGTVVAASIAAASVLGIMSHGNDEATDRAVPEDNGYPSQRSGVSDRMSRMNADGNLVFGLHNSR